MDRGTAGGRAVRMGRNQQAAQSAQTGGRGCDCGSTEAQGPSRQERGSRRQSQHDQHTQERFEAQQHQQQALSASCNPLLEDFLRESAVGGVGGGACEMPPGPETEQSDGIDEPDADVRWATTPDAVPRRIACTLSGAQGFVRRRSTSDAQRDDWLGWLGSV